MAEIITVCTEKFEMDVVKFGMGKKNLALIPGMALKPISLLADSVEAGYKIFCDEYTVYLVDRRKNIRKEYPITEMAEDTAEALKRLGLYCVDLVGASQGGMMAQIIAEKHPSLVSHLLLASTLSRNNPVSRDTFETWSRLGDGDDAVALNRDVFGRIYPDFYREKNRDVFEALEKEGTAYEMRRFAILARAGLGCDIYDELVGIKCPTLVIGDRDDRVLSGDASIEIAEKIGCELYMYEGYGHAVYDIAPDYLARMLAFFEK